MKQTYTEKTYKRTQFTLKRDLLSAMGQRSEFVHTKMSEESPPDEFVHKNMSKETCKWRGKRNIKETTCCHQVPEMRVRAHTCQKRPTHTKKDRKWRHQKRSVYCPVLGVQVRAFIYGKSTYKRDLCT